MHNFRTRGEAKCLPKNRGTNIFNEKTLYCFFFIYIKQIKSLLHNTGTFNAVRSHHFAKNIVVLDNNLCQLYVYCTVYIYCIFMPRCQLMV